MAESPETMMRMMSASTSEKDAPLTITLEKFSDSDMEPIHDLFTEGAETDPNGFGDIPADFYQAAYLKKCLSPHFNEYGIVAKEQGHVVGAIMFSLDKVEGEPPTMMIKALGTDPSFQGKGIGKNLLLTLYKIADRQQVSSIMLQPSKSKKTIQFYRNNGFEGSSTMLQIKEKIYKQELMLEPPEGTVFTPIDLEGLCSSHDDEALSSSDSESFEEPPEIIYEIAPLLREIEPLKKEVAELKGEHYEFIRPNVEPTEAFRDQLIKQRDELKAEIERLKNPPDEPDHKSCCTVS